MFRKGLETLTLDAYDRHGIDIAGFNHNQTKVVDTTVPLLFFTEGEIWGRVPRLPNEDD